MMSLDEAKVILKDSINDDGGLFNLGHYIAWERGEGEVTLDCRFTADELEAIAVYMRSDTP